MARRAKAGATGVSAGAVPEKWRLKLYVAGKAGKSLTAVANLKKLCAERLAERCEVQVIDLLKNPALAKTDGIVAIPTLVRTGPGPARRVVGDLSNAEQVLSGLALLAG